MQPETTTKETTTALDQLGKLGRDFTSRVKKSVKRKLHVELQRPTEENQRRGEEGSIRIREEVDERF